MVKHAEELLDQELVYFWQFIEISVKEKEDCYSITSSRKLRKIEKKPKKIYDSLYFQNILR